jgi:hypothetical protein
MISFIFPIFAPDIEQGCLTFQAEIIPLQPDPDNTGVGRCKFYDVFLTPFLFIF